MVLTFKVLLKSDLMIYYMNLFTVRISHIRMKE